MKKFKKRLAFSALSNLPLNTDRKIIECIFDIEHDSEKHLTQALKKHLSALETSEVSINYEKTVTKYWGVGSKRCDVLIQDHENRPFVIIEIKNRKEKKDRSNIRKAKSQLISYCNSSGCPYGIVLASGLTPILYKMYLGTDGKIEPKRILKLPSLDNIRTEVINEEENAKKRFQESFKIQDSHSNKYTGKIPKLLNTTANLRLLKDMERLRSNEE